MTKKILSVRCGFSNMGTSRNGQRRIRLSPGDGAGWRPGKDRGEGYSMLEVAADFAPGNIPIKFDELMHSDGGNAGLLISILADPTGFLAQVSWTDRGQQVIDARRVAGIEPPLLFQKIGSVSSATLITSVEFLTQEKVP